MPNIQKLIEDAHSAIVRTLWAAEEAQPIMWKAVDHHVMADGQTIGGFRSSGHAWFVELHSPVHAVQRCTVDRIILLRCQDVIGDRDLSNYEVGDMFEGDPDAVALLLAVETVTRLAQVYAHWSSIPIDDQLPPGAG